MPIDSEALWEKCLKEVEEQQKIICPFCKDKGFDLVGLKFHLENFCEVFRATESL